jgi:hypothetical protein
MLVPGGATAAATLALLRRPMARCSYPGSPWVWPSARRPAALSAAWSGLRPRGDTDSRGRNTLRGRRLFGDAAKLDAGGNSGDVTAAKSVAMLGRSVVGCALAPRIHRTPSTPGDRADSRAARSGLRPRGRAASGVVAYSEVHRRSRPNRCRRPPWPTATTCRPARPAGDPAGTGRWSMTSAWPARPAGGQRRRRRRQLR